MQAYPEKHQEIVPALMEGQFITEDDPTFPILKQEEDFYADFFEASFGYELRHEPEFYWLTAPGTDEKTSRDIAIFFAILCYELDKDGKNFLDELKYTEFALHDLAEYFKNSSWTDIIQANNAFRTEEKLKNFVSRTMTKRNIAVKRQNAQYALTKAYKLFIDFAKDLLRETPTVDTRPPQDLKVIKI